LERQCTGSVKGRCYNGRAMRMLLDCVMRLAWNKSPKLRSPERDLFCCIGLQGLLEAEGGAGTLRKTLCHLTPPMKHKLAGIHS
jgi:hypothetical protein